MTSASHLTPPVALRISLTDRCQLRCSYCLPQGPRAVHAASEILRDEEIVEFVRMVSRAAPVEKIRLTGGEPLLRAGLVDLVGKLRAIHGGELALTTNGQLLAGQAEPLRAAGLDRINLSLDSLDEGTYARLSGGGSLAPVFAGIDAARRCGLNPLKLNMVVIRGVNDREILPMVRYAISLAAEVRFLELMPIGPAAAAHAAQVFPTAEVRATLENHYELQPIPRPDGSTSRSCELRKGGRPVGRVGFISSNSHPFCGDCRRIRLTADGRMMGCLALATSVAVRPWLSEGEAGSRKLAVALGELLAGKHLRGAFRQPQAMAEIGG
jgi:GTP 3',8-cyclase